MPLTDADATSELAELKEEYDVCEGDEALTRVDAAVQVTYCFHRMHVSSWK